MNDESPHLSAIQPSVDMLTTYDESPRELGNRLVVPAAVDMLTNLPGELVMLVMARLDPPSLANLERCSSAIQSIVQEGKLWKRLAEEANKADPFPFITGMLKYASMRQVSDSKAFKIILGARRQIELIVGEYQREMKELRMEEVGDITPRPGFFRRETSDIRIVLIEKSVGQVKALSRKHLMMEEKDYPVMSEHRALFHRILSPANLDVARGLIQVKAVIEKLNFVKQQHQPSLQQHQLRPPQLSLQQPSLQQPSLQQPSVFQLPIPQCNGSNSPKSENV